MAGLGVIAPHLDLAERRLRELVAAGVITKRDHGSYDVDEVRVEYIRYLRGAATGKSKGSGDLAAAKLRREEAAAETAELELAELQGDLVQAHDVESRWNKIGASLRTNLLAIPSKMAPRCEGRTKAEIEHFLSDEIADLLEGISGKTDRDT